MAYTDYVFIPKKTMTYGNITGAQVADDGLHIGYNGENKDFVFLGYEQITPLIKGAYYVSGNNYKFMVCSQVGFYDYGRTLLGLGTETTNGGESWSTISYNTASLDETTQLYNATVGGNVTQQYMNPKIPVYDSADLALAAMNDGIWSEADIPKNYNVLNKIDTVTASEIKEKGNFLTSCGESMMTCARTSNKPIKWGYVQDEENTRFIMAGVEAYDDVDIEYNPIKRLHVKFGISHDGASFSIDDDYNVASRDKTTGLYYIDGVVSGVAIQSASIVPRYDTVAEALTAMNNTIWTQPEENIINNNMVANIEPQDYTGEEIEPSVVVTYDDTVLTIDTDYIMLYDNNVDAGIATVYIKGVGDYAGIATKGFTIKGGTKPEKKKKGRKNIMVGGYCLVEGIGISLSAEDSAVVNGIYEAVKSAIDTNKPIIIYDTVTDAESGSKVSPLGCACSIDSESGTITVRTYIGITFTIATDDTLTIVTE